MDRTKKISFLSLAWFSLFLSAAYGQLSTEFTQTNMTNLRVTIDAKRAQCGLASYGWTDLIAAGVTPIRAVHVTDLRDAINEIYALAPQSTSYPFTDVTLTPNVTPIKETHLQEIQDAIDNLTCCGDGSCDEPPENSSNCPADCGEACVANGDTCSAGNDCCSGLCVKGFCQKTCQNVLYAGQACSDDAKGYNFDGTCLYSLPTRYPNPTVYCEEGEVARYPRSPSSAGYYKGCNALMSVMKGLSPSSYPDCDYSGQHGFNPVGVCAVSGSTAQCVVDKPSAPDLCYDGEYIKIGCNQCYTSGPTVFTCDDRNYRGGSYSAYGICTADGCRTGPVCYDGSFYRRTSYYANLCDDGDPCDSSVFYGIYKRDGYVCSNLCIVDGSRSSGQRCCRNANCASGVCSGGSCN